MAWRLLLGTFEDVVPKDMDAFSNGHWKVQSLRRSSFWPFKDQSSISVEKDAWAGNKVPRTYFVVLVDSSDWDSVHTRSGYSTERSSTKKEWRDYVLGKPDSKEASSSIVISKFEVIAFVSLDADGQVIKKIYNEDYTKEGYIDCCRDCTLSKVDLIVSQLPYTCKEIDQWPVPLPVEDKQEPCEKQPSLPVVVSKDASLQLHFFCEPNNDGAPISMETGPSAVRCTS